MLQFFIDLLDLAAMALVMARIPRDLKVLATAFGASPRCVHARARSGQGGLLHERANAPASVARCIHRLGADRVGGDSGVPVRVRCAGRAV